MRLLMLLKKPVTVPVEAVRVHLGAYRPQKHG